MKEAVTTSRGSRSRRTIATLTWAGLVVAAGLLWHGRLHGTMRSATTEPIALLLSAYTAFSSIFAWMLFSPNRRAAAESPALFLAGGITLLPPCIISYCLMPPDSPLRGWVTVGVFLLTVAAVVSPVPDEFFAVPRDRSTYLRPISDAMFTSLDVLDLRAGFEHLQTIETRQPSRLTPYSPETVEWPTRSGDPWENPFLGTGIEPIRPAIRRRSQHTDSQTRSQTAAAADNPPAGHHDAAREAAREGTAARYADAVRDAAQLTASTALRRAAQSTTAAGTAATPSTSSARRPGSELPASHHALGAQRPAAAFGFRPPAAETPQPQPSAATSTARLQPAPVRVPAPAARPASPTTAPPLAKPVIPAVPAVPPPLPGTPPSLPEASADAATPVAYAYVPPGSQAPAVAASPAAPAQSPFEDFVSQRTRDDLADSSTMDDRTALDNRTAAAEDNGLKAERIRDEYGGEMVEGTVRVVFETGQKRANLHIPFTPPLPGIPEVECESVGDDVLRLKVPVRQPYGIRIEARRSDASGPLETEIGFAAVYSPQRR